MALRQMTVPVHTWPCRGCGALTDSDDGYCLLCVPVGYAGVPKQPREFPTEEDRSTDS